MPRAVYCKMCRSAARHRTAHVNVRKEVGSGRSQLSPLSASRDKPHRLALDVSYSTSDLTVEADLLYEARGASSATWS